MMSRPAESADTPTFDLLIARSGLPRLEARALLEQCCGKSREWLIAHGDERPCSDQVRAYEALVAQRRDVQAPLAYLLGWREFHGRPFLVSPAVLIPRPETELLVQQVISRAGLGARVLELGTGSGCIAVTLACEREDLAIVATDLSPAALGIAQRNAEQLCARALEDARLAFRAGSWWDALRGEEQFELIVSNPPYIAAADPHLAEGDLRFEPADALASGPDGLTALRVICTQSKTHLLPGGVLIVEHGFDQGEAVSSLMIDAGLHNVHVIKDDAGLDRITIGEHC